MLECLAGLSGATHEAVKQLEADTHVVVSLMSDWRIYAVEHVEDPGISSPEPEFYRATQLLAAWCDHAGIDGASAITETYRLVAAFYAPGPPWGKKPKRSELIDALGRAWDVTERAFIRAAAMSESAGAPPNLSDRQQMILLMLFKNDCIDSKSRMTMDSIAPKIDAGTRAANYKRAAAALKPLGLVDSKPGRDGGYWLTIAGRSLVKRTESPPNRHP